MRIDALGPISSGHGLRQLHKAMQKLRGGMFILPIAENCTIRNRNTHSYAHIYHFHNCIHNNVLRKSYVHIFRLTRLVRETISPQKPTKPDSNEHFNNGCESYTKDRKLL